MLPTPEYLLRAQDRIGVALEALSRCSPIDVPVAAAIFDPDGHLIATASNEKELRHDPTAHAEVLAIRKAAAAHGDSWHLEQCTLAVTLEPCAMCAGAILASRIGTVIFGAYEPKTGACGSVVDLIRDLNPEVEVIGGIREEECAAPLVEFFQAKREQP